MSHEKLACFLVRASVRPEIRPSMGAHTCNLRYSGVRDMKIVVQGKQEQKSHQDLISMHRLCVMHHSYNPSNNGDGQNRIMVPQAKTHMTLLEK
jgi:hypothetical protein